ncbi:hypothetical protein GOC48_16470 [Sinorhizobium meliloti]|nr:hypothetical protein [Sinorhizobium meliloti]
MDLIATRGVFGDFGRLKKGDVVRDVSKSQAEKMLKSGGYKTATAAEIKAAEERKKAGVPNAKTTAIESRKTANDGAKAEIDKVRREASAEIEKILAAAKADVDAARKEADQAKEDLRLFQKQAADDIANVKAALADEIAKVKADADAKIAAAAGAKKG